MVHGWAVEALEDGEWEDEEWEDGEWEDGEWEDGEWEDGEWEDGECGVEELVVVMGVVERS